MEAACCVMNSPNNNRYNILYIIDKSLDMTEAFLPKVDEWVLDRQVVDIILTLYSNVTSDWARTFREDAEHFFTGPPFVRLLFTMKMPTNHEQQIWYHSCITYT